MSQAAAGEVVIKRPGATVKLLARGAAPEHAAPTQSTPALEKDAAATTYEAELAALEKKYFGVVPKSEREALEAKWAQGSENSRKADAGRMLLRGAMKG